LLKKVAELLYNPLFLLAFSSFLCHKPSKFNHREESMGYKKMKQNLGFADFALASSMKHNRSLENMQKLDKAIDWSRVETILMNHYTVGTSGEGADGLLKSSCIFL
jgi:hypothetical protein